MANKGNNKPNTPANNNEGKEPADNSNGGAAPSNDNDKSFTKDDLETAVAAAVAKAKKDWDKENQDKEEKAKLTEEERIKSENDSLKRELQMTKAEANILKELKDAGAKAPKLLFDSKKGELEFDDKGNLKNLSELISTLKTDYADQFEPEKPAESIDAGAGQQNDKERAETLNGALKNHYKK